MEQAYRWHCYLIISLYFSCGLFVSIVDFLLNTSAVNFEGLGPLFDLCF